MKHGRFIHCTRCDSPVPMKFGDAFGFDVETILCSECRPAVRAPGVHLYGAPDGQEMARWSQAKYTPAATEEEILGVVLDDPANPFLS